MVEWWNEDEYCVDQKAEKRPESGEAVRKRRSDQKAEKRNPFRFRTKNDCVDRFPNDITADLAACLSFL